MSGLRPYPAFAPPPPPVDEEEEHSEDRLKAEEEALLREEEMLRLEEETIRLERRHSSARHQPAGPGQPPPGAMDEAHQDVLALLDVLRQDAGAAGVDSRQASADRPAVARAAASAAAAQELDSIMRALEEPSTGTSTGQQQQQPHRPRAPPSTTAAQELDAIISGLDPGRPPERRMTLTISDLIASFDTAGAPPFPPPQPPSADPEAGASASALAASLDAPATLDEQLAKLTGPTNAPAADLALFLLAYRDCATPAEAMEALRRRWLQDEATAGRVAALLQLWVERRWADFEPESGAQPAMRRLLQALQRTRHPELFAVRDLLASRLAAPREGLAALADRDGAGAGAALPQPLAALAAQFAEPGSGVPTARRTCAGRSYAAVFTGEQAVSWLLVARQLATRAEALALGRRLWAAGVFSHVAHEHTLKDAPLLYYLPVAPARPPSPTARLGADLFGAQPAAAQGSACRTLSPPQARPTSTQSAAPDRALSPERALSPTRGRQGGSYIGARPRRDGVKRATDLTPEELAQQLALLDLDLFAAIRPAELLGCQWTDAEAKKERAPHVIAFIEQFNKIGNWAATAVLLEEERLGRRKAIAHLLATVDELVRLRCWNTAIALFCGLRLSFITRLGDDADLPPKAARLLETLGAKLDVAKPRELRALFRSGSRSGVPYLGHYLTDLLHAVEGLPRTVEGGKINFRRLNRAARLVEELVQFQETTVFSFEPLPDFVEYWKTAPVLTEKEMQETSEARRALLSDGRSPGEAWTSVQTAIGGSFLSLAHSLKNALPAPAEQRAAGSTIRAEPPSLSFSATAGGGSFVARARGLRSRFGAPEQPPLEAAPKPADPAQAPPATSSVPPPPASGEPADPVPHSPAKLDLRTWAAAEGELEQQLADCLRLCREQLPSKAWLLPADLAALLAPLEAAASVHAALRSHFAASASEPGLSASAGEAEAEAEAEALLAAVPLFARSADYVALTAAARRVLNAVAVHPLHAEPWAAWAAEQAAALEAAAQLRARAALAPSTEAPGPFAVRHLVLEAPLLRLEQSADLLEAVVRDAAAPPAASLLASTVALRRVATWARARVDALAAADDVALLQKILTGCPPGWLTAPARRLLRRGSVLVASKPRMALLFSDALLICKQTKDWTCAWERLVDLHQHRLSFALLPGNRAVEIVEQATGGGPAIALLEGPSEGETKAWADALAAALARVRHSAFAPPLVQLVDVSSAALLPLPRLVQHLVDRLTAQPAARLLFVALPPRAQVLAIKERLGRPGAEPLEACLAACTPHMCAALLLEFLNGLPAPVLDADAAPAALLASEPLLALLDAALPAARRLSEAVVALLQTLLRPEHAAANELTVQRLSMAVGPALIRPRDGADVGSAADVGKSARLAQMLLEGKAAAAEASRPAPPAAPVPAVPKKALPPVPRRTTAGAATILAPVPLAAPASAPPAAPAAAAPPATDQPPVASPATASTSPPARPAAATISVAGVRRPLIRVHLEQTSKTVPLEPALTAGELVRRLVGKKIGLVKPPEAYELRVRDQQEAGALPDAAQLDALPYVRASLARGITPELLIAERAAATVVAPAAALKRPAGVARPPRFAVAKQEYVPTESGRGYLAVRRDEVVQVLEAGGGGWWVVQNASGGEGFVSSAYFKDAPHLSSFPAASARDDNVMEAR